MANVSQGTRCPNTASIGHPAGDVKCPKSAIKLNCRMTQFEFDVLGAVSNDYEAAHTICADLARDRQRPVSLEEVNSALVSLAHMELVDAFIYDPSTNAFQKTSQGPALPGDIWFMINAAGRAEYERFGG